MQRTLTDLLSDIRDVVCMTRELDYISRKRDSLYNKVLEEAMEAGVRVSLCHECGGCGYYTLTVGAKSVRVSCKKCDGQGYIVKI